MTPTDSPCQTLITERQFKLVKCVWSIHLLRCNSKIE